MRLSIPFSQTFRSKDDVGDADNAPSSKLFRILAGVRRHNPLTLTGWAVTAGAVYLLGTGFAADNAYSFLLATVFFALIIVLGIATRLEARRARSFDFDWGPTASLVARQAAPSQRIVNSGFRPLPFLRVHMELRGRFAPGKRRRFRITRDVSFHHDPEVSFGLHLPCAGTLHVRYQSVVRDVFGLARAVFGDEAERVLPVRPGHVADRRPPNIEAQQGDEDQNRMKSSEVERYFMREYMPGDRERDINWKASSRFDQLFTRISPVTQEKTQLITVYFRPYTSADTESTEGMLILDRCKSMLLFFIRSVRSMHPDYEFRLFIGSDLVEIESDDDVEQLSADIASVHFREYGGMSEFDPADPTDGAYVFTTACDTGLNEFLDRMRGDSVEVYRSYAVRRLEPGDESGVTLRLFDSVDSFIPGFLLLPSSRYTRNPMPVHTAASVTDEPVEVHLA